jgi:hypothetical protein
MDTGALAEIRNHARQLRINIEIGGRGLTDENLHQHIDLAFFFGSPVLRMVIDGQDYEPDLDTIEAVIRCLGPWNLHGPWPEVDGCMPPLSEDR